MDGLSTSLNSSNIGGHIGGNLLNNLCYAGDTCLISLTSAGLQRLLNICIDYAEQNSLGTYGRILLGGGPCYEHKT